MRPVEFAMPNVRRILRLALVCAAVWVVLPVVAPAGEPSPASLGDDGVIYPRNSSGASPASPAGGTFSMWGVLGLVVALAGGGVYLLKRGHLGARNGAALQQRLSIEETRPLGNKQYLAVAAYGDRKLLLSVCPGRIDLLCRLDEAAGAAKSAAGVHDVVAE